MTSGNTYVVVHTSQNPPGEIRGFINQGAAPTTSPVTPTPTPAPSTTTPTATPTPTQTNITLFTSEYKFGLTAASQTSPGPTLNLKVGTPVTVTVTNTGTVGHTWALVNATTGGSVLFNAAIASAANPIPPGQTRTVTFTPTQAGNYFYICTVPGHVQLGMWGNVVVSP